MLVILNIFVFQPVSAATINILLEYNTFCYSFKSILQLTLIKNRMNRNLLVMFMEAFASNLANFNRALVKLNSVFIISILTTSTCLLIFNSLNGYDIELLLSNGNWETERHLTWLEPANGSNTTTWSSASGSVGLTTQACSPLHNCSTFLAAK